MDPALAGALFAVSAYLAWGLVPIYWKVLGPVPSLEVLAHRVIWSALFLVPIVTVFRAWPRVLETFRSWRRMRVLLASTVLISANWGIFIWAVQTGHLVEASLGYYINPLLNVALGVLLLGERLRRLQMVAVAMAATGVLWLGVRSGVTPTVSLVLAGTFGAYGLLRKTAEVDAITGLFVETVMLAPFALAYVIRAELAGHGALTTGTLGHGTLLAASGLVTALPLLWFASAARRMPLSRLGFFQYISPTCQLLLAVLAYGEKATAAHVVAFSCIWAGLAVYSIDARLAARTA
jgi:chloramphenicol-sensitive protein RarD